MELIETLTDRQFNRLVFLEKYLRLQESKMDHLKKEFLKVHEAAVEKNRKIKALKTKIFSLESLSENLLKAERGELYVAGREASAALKAKAFIALCRQKFSSDDYAEMWAEVGTVLKEQRESLGDPNMPALKQIRIFDKLIERPRKTVSPVTLADTPGFILAFNNEVASGLHKTLKEAYECVELKRCRFIGSRKYKNFRSFSRVKKYHTLKFAPSIEAASFCKERAKDRAESEQGAQPLNDL
jgi:hypothetical protein